MIGENEIKKRIYHNIDPFQYPLDSELADLYDKTVVQNKRVKRAGDLTGFKYYDESLKLRDPIFYKYLGLSGVKRKDNTYNLKKSKYRPTQGAENVDYYKHPGLNNGLRNYAKYANGLNNPVQQFIDEGLKLSEGHNTISSAFTDAFGVHTIGKGYDNNGTYISYYDKWDLTPLKLYEKAGLLHPVNFYDRFYLDDIMGLDKDAVRGTHWLPGVEVERRVRSKKQGGNITIQRFQNGSAIKSQNGVLSGGQIGKITNNGYVGAKINKSKPMYYYDPNKYTYGLPVKPFNVKEADAYVDRRMQSYKELGIKSNPELNYEENRRLLEWYYLQDCKEQLKLKYGPQKTEQILREYGKRYYDADAKRREEDYKLYMKSGH